MAVYLFYRMSLDIEVLNLLYVSITLEFCLSHSIQRFPVYGFYRSLYSYGKGFNTSNYLFQTETFGDVM